MGSLTGAVASQRVTEAREGLSPIGNRAASVMAQGSLTARQTCRAGAKAGHSDPVVLYGKAIDQHKRYSGDNRLITPKSSHDGVVWHLDVGSSHPGAEVGPKGMAVRHLKRYASWVQNVVRQFVPICKRKL